MKNLDLYSIESHLKDDSPTNVIQSLVVNKRLYCLRENDNETHSVHLFDPETSDWTVFDFEGKCANMEFLTFDDRLFLTSKNCLMFLTPDLTLAKLITLEGQENILVTKWTIIQDTVAIYFENDQLGLYKITIAEGKVDLIGATDFNDQPIQHIDVGWGGRHKYKRPMNPLDSTYVCENRHPTLDWRGNSELIAVNYFNGEERIIKVYNDECDLLYTSKGILSGLEAPLAFKPAGNMIACVSSSNGFDQRLMIIEKNCMIQTLLNIEEGAKVEKIKWTPCSTLLTVQLKGIHESWLDFYTLHNFKFELKQRVCLPKTNAVIDYAFKSVLPGLYSLQLHVSNGYYEYLYMRKFSRSCVRRYDYSLIINIMGNMLHCYYYASAMASPSNGPHHVFVHEAPINALVLLDYDYKLIFVDSENDLYIYDYRDRHNWDMLHKIELPYSEALPLHCYRFHLDTSQKLSVICHDEGDSDLLYTYDLNIMDPTPIKSEIKKNVIKVANVSSRMEGLQTIYYHKDLNAMPIMEFYFIEVDGETHEVYMAVDGRFYIDKTRCEELISSLYVSGNRLTVTAIDAEIELLATDYAYSFLLAADKLKKLKEGSSLEAIAYKRPVEQGSLILTTLQNTATTLLYLPRGNVESIELRNLALIQLSKLIENQKYVEALKYMRKQSLRLDFILDVNPTNFMVNKLAIFKALDTVACLNKFFIELRNECCLNAKDIGYLGVDLHFENKVAKAASAFEEIFLRLQDPSKYLTTYALATYFTDRNIYGTMTTISKLCNSVAIDPDEIVNAIEVLCNHVNVKDLYEACLFTFDLNLSELVATRSQMDPRIYGPFIQKLNTMGMLERRYTICTSIGKYKEALVYYFMMYRDAIISDIALLTFTTDRNLVRELYNMVEDIDEIYEDVCFMYFELLVEDHNYMEAGILANKLGRFHESVAALLKGFHWQEALTVIDTAMLQPAESLMLYRDVADTLRNHRSFLDAAKIYIQQCNDCDAGLQCYIDGKHFEFALRLASRLGSVNVQTKIVENIVTECANVDARLTQLSTNFTEYFERLKIVRLKKKKDAEDGAAAGPSYHEFSDVMSVTTAGTSMSTRTRSSNRSNRSVTRRQKKEEKKYRNMKENSKYEDIALLYNLTILVEDVKDLRNEINELYNCIQLRDLDVPDIVPICERIDELIKLIDQHLPEIWKPEFAVYQPRPEDQGVHNNLVFLDAKYRVKPDLNANLKERATMLFLKRR